MTQPRAFSKVRSLACLALLLLFVSGSGAQQGTSGSIEGTITDQQGGAIANAKLTAVNAATGLTLQASSDDNGLFHFLAVPVGTYLVTVEHSGFAKSRRSGAGVRSTTRPRPPSPVRPGQRSA